MLDKKCSVIVVTYNGKKEWYDKCFQSLLSSSVPLEVIVVDNKSTDDSVSYISENFPEVKIIQSNKNLGFAGGNNIGLNVAYNNNADYFFLLNQDAWVESNTIETLITVAEKEQDFGILSPLHLTADKNSFETHFRNFFNKCSNTLYAYENLYFKKQEPILYESDFVNAAAWLISKKCIEIVGGFDTILFKHYGEDSNYCHRVLYHKLKIGIVPSVTICHDRIGRVDKFGEDVNFYNSVFWGNILLPSEVYFKHLIKIFAGIIRGKNITKNLGDVFWTIKKFKSITKSRKINKRAKCGLMYIEKLLEKKEKYKCPNSQ